MRLLILAALVYAQLPSATVTRVDLATITLEEAKALDGKPVVARFVVAKPAYTWGEGKTLYTVVGPKDLAGEPTRAVHLVGDRLHDADMGAKVTVVGTLRVIRLEPKQIGKTEFTGHTEIRIVEDP